jgi:hypothetical protein
MNGQCVRCINTQLISEKDTFLCISRGNLKAETEDELEAVQEQVYQNKYYAKKQYNKIQIVNADYAENMTIQ